MTYDDPARCDASGPIPDDGPLLWTRPPSLRPPPLPAGPWHFCGPARPAPLPAGDPAWLVFLGVASPPAPESDRPWVEFLMRRGRITPGA